MSWLGNAFRISVCLWVESSVHRWSPITMGQWCHFDILLSILITCKTNSQLPSDLRCHDAHVSVISYPFNTLRPSNSFMRRRINHHSLTFSQWSSSGNPVAIQCAWNLDPSVHWNATGEMPVCFQWCSSGVPVAFQWSSSVFQLCKWTLDRHWDTTRCWHQPMWFQWHPSVLVAPVVFQCVPIMQINTGSPLEHHWALASASVVPVAFQCTCGSSGLPVWSVQWHPSVPSASVTDMARVVWAKLISIDL